MNKQISLSQYRNIDLSLMAVILLISQVAIGWASRGFFSSELYVVSPAAAVVAIVMMRWGPYAGIHAVIAGAVFCVMSSGGPEHYLIYCAGNLLSLAALSFFSGSRNETAAGKERVRNSVWLSLAFGAAVQLLMWVGRAGLAMLLGKTAEEAFGFITTDSLSAVFTLVIIWVARRANGLFEDQRLYIRRLHAEEEKKELGISDEENPED